jgi:glycosyltransferase involved in cell wall biosynthesis
VTFVSSPAGALRLTLLIPTLEGGGAEVIAIELANEFARRGHDVELVAMHARGPYLQRVGAGVRLIDLRHPRLWTSLIAWLRYVHARNPDAVLAIMTLANAFAGWSAAWLRARWVAVGSQRIHWSEPRRSAPLRRIEKMFVRGGYRRLDGLTAVSEGVAASVAEGGWVDRARIRAIANPLRHDFAPTAMRAPQPPGGPVRLLAVGRLVAQKGYPTLLRSVARVAAVHDVHLDVAGEGSERERLIALADELGIAARVTWHGWVANVTERYQAADLYVSASSREGFPNALLEALAHGLPVVATDCPSGPAEILAGGAYGALVAVGDDAALAAAILQALANRHDPQRLMARAREFGIDRAADAYLAFIAEVRARKGEQRP